MFSCRTRGFCPSCHAKRLEEWGEWMKWEAPRCILFKSRAGMIRKVYEVDPMLYPQCGGTMKVIVFITDFGAVDRIITTSS